MNRKDFIKSSVIISGASLLPNSVFSHHLDENGIDKLTDAEGNFFHRPLPYSQNFLEPAMDEETLNLHYTFHHGGAVKAANKDLQQIKKAMEENNLETIDHWTKKLLITFHLISFTVFSGQTLPTKKQSLQATCLKR
jgi:superoxide dismutase, Fe-Mn family